MYSSSPTLTALPPNYIGNSLVYLFINSTSICAMDQCFASRIGWPRIGRSTYLRDQDTVTGSNAHGEALAVLVEDTGANSEDLGLVLLLDAALGEEDTGGGLGLGLDTLDQDAVEEGSKALDVAEERLIKQSMH